MFISPERGDKFVIIMHPFISSTLSKVDEARGDRSDTARQCPIFRILRDVQHFRGSRLVTDLCVRL